MFAIMESVHAGLDRQRFETDLAGKDEIILMLDADGVIGGFSTQRVLTGQAAGREVTGFSPGIP